MKEPLHGRIHSLTTNHFSSVSVLRDSLLPKIDRLVRGTLFSWQDGQKVILLKEAKKMSFELIIKQLISEDPSDWTEALRREYLFLVDGFISVPLPSFLSSFGSYGKGVRARAKVAEMLRVFVMERRAEKRDVPKDMLDELMLMKDGLDDHGMVDFLVSMLLAGYDTSSIIMTAAIKFLTDNPEALEQLKEEHEEIMRGKKNHDDHPLEWSDYQSMTFTQCVINETLRLTNFAVGVIRRTKTDIHFKGYTIPEGCKVFPWFLGVHLNAEHFTNPRAFDPWRWQSVNSSDQNGKIFTPFGGGPRLCPGNKLARLVISVFLHYFVTRLEWKATEKDDLVFFPTPRTPKGYPIIVKRK